MKFAVSLVALLAATGFVQAADINEYPLVSEPIVSPNLGIQGTIEAGVLATHLNDTDGSNNLWVYGGYTNAALWGQSNSIIWGIDGYLDGNSFDRSVDRDIPTYVGVLGGHLGFDTGSGSFGAFASFGAISDDDVDFTTRWGYTVGAEGIAELSSGFSLFGQIGYADIRADEGPTNEGFTGAFGRVGGMFALSDDLAVLADLSAGSSSSYVDGNDGGGFVAAGLKSAFRLPTEFDAFLTAGYEYAHYSATTDSDTGTTHTVKLGLSIPFGDSTTSSDTLNPLATSALPYRAASWANAID